MKWVGACVNLRRQWFPHALPRALNAASGGLCVWFTAVPKKEDGWCSARQDRFSPGRGNLNCTSDCGLSSGSSASGCHKSLARGSKAAGPHRRFMTAFSWSLVKGFVPGKDSYIHVFVFHFVYSFPQMCDFPKLNSEWQGICFKVTWPQREKHLPLGSSRASRAAENMELSSSPVAPPSGATASLKKTRGRRSQVKKLQTRIWKG